MKHFKKYSAKTQTQEVATPEGAMRVYLAYPEQASETNFPALIVLQEAFGVNHHMKDLCRRLAELGYVAVAPELYHRSGQGVEVEYSNFAQARPFIAELTNEKLLADVTAAFEFLKSFPGVDKERIGTIGFCMGGFTAILGATGLPLSAAVSYYGGGINKARPGIGFSPLLQELGKIHCPVLLVYGETDHSITSQDVEETRQAFARAEKDFVLRVYPEAGHGFFCDERPSYNPVAASLSWQESMDWLREKMK